MTKFLVENWFKMALIIIAIVSLFLFHEWVVLQETNSVVACEEANSGTSFCVTWYKAEFNRVFPN